MLAGGDKIMVEFDIINNSVSRIIKESYEFTISFSYASNNYVRVHSHSKENLSDSLVRLAPYFNTEQNSIRNTRFQNKFYNIYLLEADNHFVLFNTLQNLFTHDLNKILGHAGNTVEQLRFYSVFKFGAFNLFENQEKNTYFIQFDNIVILISNDVSFLSLESRRIIKDVILSRDAEANNSLIYHCSCASFSNDGIVIVGEKGSGKTTTLLKLLSEGGSFVTSDRGYLNVNDFCIRGWPEPLNVSTTVLELFGYPILSNDSVKSNGKISIPYTNLAKRLKINLSCSSLISTFVFPVVNLTQKTVLRKASEDECRYMLLKNCLTPNDFEHPHWMDIVSIDCNLIYKKLPTLVDSIIKQIPCFILSIGYDFTANYSLVNNLVNNHAF